MQIRSALLLALKTGLQVTLPVAPKAATGDALLVPAAGEAILCHSTLLALESDVLFTAVELGKAQADEERHALKVQQEQGQGEQDEQGEAPAELLRLTLPCTTQAEAVLLVAALYARFKLDTLLDSLPGDRVLDLASIAHRFACTEILGEVDKALVRKCTGAPDIKIGWLRASNALWVLGWAESRGLSGLQKEAAKYVAAHHSGVALSGAAAEAGENLVMVLEQMRIAKA